MKVWHSTFLSIALVAGGLPFQSSATPRLPLVLAPSDGIILVQGTGDDDDDDGGNRGGGVGNSRGGEPGRRTDRMVQENPIFGVSRRAVQRTTAVTRRFESAIEECSLNDPMQLFHHCVATAMETFAAELEAPEIALPEETQPVPAIIRRAAARVRAAPSRPAARAAVTEAVQEVRKSITLIRADEPAFTSLANMQTRQGNAIADSLQVAEAKLERAVGL